MTMKVTYDLKYPGGAVDNLDGIGTPVKLGEFPEDWKGNKEGAAEMQSDIATGIEPALSTNFGGKLSDNSTVQDKTCATFRGDEESFPPVPVKLA